MRQLVLRAAIAVVLLQFTCLTVHAVEPPQRIVVHSQAELPPHSYRLSTPTASELLEGGPAMDALAAQLRADTEATLSDYDIQDKAALRSIYATLSNLALLRGDTATVTTYSQKYRASVDNPASRLLVGIEAEAAAAALAAGDNQARAHALYQDHLANAIKTMPWGVVGDEIRGRKSGDLVPGAKIQTVGMVQSRLDPVVARGEPLSKDMAASLLAGRLSIALLAQFKPDNVAVYRAYIQAHEQARPDIWPSRMQALDPSEILTPVVVAVWDEGVDTALFPGRLWTNPGERVDARDDDGNGYVDDVHGISFDENGAPAIGPVILFDQRYSGREAELRELFVGELDAEADRDTPAARAFRNRMDTLSVDEVAPLREASTFYASYSHGTATAAITMAGNPAARLLVIRSNSSGYLTTQPAVTPAIARQDAVITSEIVTYLRTHGTRVVNMSFGIWLEAIEGTLAANGVGKTPDERKAIALEVFHIYADAYRNAIASAPEILFIPAAGNINSEIGFALDTPSNIDLPNVLTVGAVDRAGDPANFTNHGRLVRIYAPGVEVESTLPGGGHVVASGTSLAAPAVSNLAAKLFAIDPSLTPEQAIALILEGASTSKDGKYRLLNPKHSIALLKSRLAALTQSDHSSSAAHQIRNAKRDNHKQKSD